MSIQELDQAAQEVASTHPLDPLTANEISYVRAILKESHAEADTFRFAQIALNEPAKQELRKNPNGVQREASCVLIDRATGNSYDAIVNLESSTVTDWRQRDPRLGHRRRSRTAVA